jgi:excisionase family DNA binding protein
VTAPAAGEHRRPGVEVSQGTLQRSTSDRRPASRSVSQAATAEVPLTIEAAAERLGVTPRLVRRLVNERRIGFVRVGKFIRLRQHDLDVYLETHFQPPVR